MPEALIEVMGKDTRLDVLAVSIRSFEQVTGYVKKDVLDDEPAYKYWAEKKEEIQKNLKKTDPETTLLRRHIKQAS